jgi:hypothetical protein
VSRFGPSFLLFALLLGPVAAGAAEPLDVAARLRELAAMPEAQRVAGQRALAEQGGEVVAALASAAADRRLADEVTQVALVVLGEVGSAEACAGLPNEAALEGRSAAIGLAAAVARARCGSSSALQLRLGSVDARVRAKAAVALGILGRSELLVPVVAASSDPANAGYATFWALARGLMGDGSVSGVVEVLERQPATARLGWLARMRSSPLGPAEDWQPGWLEEADPLTGEALVGEYLRRCEAMPEAAAKAAELKWPRLAPRLARGCGAASP